MSEKNAIYKEALKHPIFEIVVNTAFELQQETYVIGGFVRNFFLGNSTKDIDIVTLGSGIELALSVSKKLPNQPKVKIFKNFGTAMLHCEDVEIEFVGARKESYSKSSRNPEVEEGSLVDDQNRRDFTVNTLAFSLNKENFGTLLDTFNGIEDLKNKIIRTPLEPSITYSDDPLRMLRAIRFATQLGFSIEENSLEAIKEKAGRLKIISQERIVDELHKILETDKPSVGFLLLEETHLLKEIMPELTDLKGVDEIDGKKHKDNFYHTLEVVDNIAQTTKNLWLRWAALLHDIGKFQTKKFTQTQGWTFHGHELEGAKMVYLIFKRLRMPLNDKMKFVQKMVFLSSRPIALIDEEVTDAAVRRLLFDAGDYLSDLMLLCEADITTKNPFRFKKYHDNFERVRAKLEEVEQRDSIRNFQPPISGDNIMEIFNLTPCREIGIIKDAIKEAILNGVIKNEYDDAYAFMLDKAASMNLKVVQNKKLSSQKT